MAHNLNFNEITGKYSFFSVKEKAWHNLGQIVDEYPTAAEAITAAQLDWDVIKAPIMTAPTDDQEPQQISTHFATMRSDTRQVLGIVGKKYEVVNNRDAFRFFDAIVGGDEGIFYETAGALGNGEQIFITAKLPDFIKVDKKDLIEKYIFLTTSHDGSGSIQAAFTPVRIVCNNTLTAALKNHSNMITIRHTVGAKQQLEMAHRVMGISNQLAKELEPIFQSMAHTWIKDEDLQRLIALAMAPTDLQFQAIRDKRTDFEFSTQFLNICEDVFEYAQTAETQQMDTTRGTLFGAYNAITGYYQNVREYKNKSAKLASLIDGTASNRSSRAFNICFNHADYLS